MKIQEITNCGLVIQELIGKFITQLVGQKTLIKYNHIEEIISDHNSHLFFAISKEGKYMGMLTVGFYISPSGKKSWIEDVLVDEIYRGKGIGKALVEFAIQFAKDKKSTTIMLTSIPKRISANKLYQKIGFQQKETNVYLMQIEKQ